MKKSIIAVAALALISILTGCTRIEPGHVGVEINLAGSQRGASEIPVRTGWVFYNPLSTSIIEYPTFVQTATWTAREGEGRSTDDSITFNSREGMTVTADISLSYQLAAEKVPDFYVKFRSDDLNNFTHGFLRNIARDQFVEVASNYTIEEIYGSKKEEFLARVKSAIAKEVQNIGVNIQQFGLIGAPRVPELFLQAMNAKVTAIQQAEQTKNELARTQAEANKEVAEAEGRARAMVARANGEAEANRTRAASVSPALLEMRRLDNQHDLIWKWDGRRPNIEGEGKLGGMLMQLPQEGK